MDQLKKTPVDTVLQVLRVLMLVLVLFYGGSGVLSGLDSCAHYRQVRDSAVTVEAVVAKVDRIDADEGWEYDVYIRYGYEGENYEVLYLNDTDDGQWKNRLGQTVSVEIDPADPGVLVSALLIPANNMWLYLLVMNLWVIFWPIRIHPGWTQTYGCSREYVQRDLEIKLNKRWMWKWGLLSGVQMLVLGVVFADVLGGKMLFCGVLFALLGLKGYKRFRRDMEKIRNGEFTFREDLLVEKYEESDGDCGMNYVLVYAGEQGNWKKLVDSNEYARSQVGQVKRVVYLDGEKEPALELTGRGTI